jgi:hypothetical protein
MKTTNYFSTFIEVADDCPVTAAEEPPRKSDELTAARMQYEMLANSPYKHTSDDVLFHVFAVRNKIAPEDLARSREQFFSKGQPCFRASPLTKRYGWGVHSNRDGRIALFPLESKKYAKLAADRKLSHVKAMGSKRG